MIIKGINSRKFSVFTSFCTSRIVSQPFFEICFVAKDNAHKPLLFSRLRLVLQYISASGIRRDSYAIGIAVANIYHYHTHTCLVLRVGSYICIYIYIKINTIIPHYNLNL